MRIQLLWVALLASSLQAVCVPARAAEPAGTLIICGGGALPEPILARFVELAGNKEARLVLIPTASARADEPGSDRWTTAWQDFPVASLDILHTRSRELADESEFSRVLTTATGVWISGGSQSRLADAYAGTLVEKRIRQLLARGGVVGGSSAGAAIMSKTMIASGNPRPVIRKGLGLMADVIIDQHFSQRNRRPRLEHALMTHRELIGMGIDESTAVEVRGRKALVLGKNSVFFLVPSNAKDAASNAKPRSDQLRQPERYDLKLRRPIPESETQRRESDDMATPTGNG